MDQSYSKETPIFQIDFIAQISSRQEGFEKQSIMKYKSIGTYSEFFEYFLTQGGLQKLKDFEFISEWSHYGKATKDQTY